MLEAAPRDGSPPFRAEQASGEGASGEPLGAREAGPQKRRV